MTLSIDGAIVLTEPNKPHTQTQRTHDSATGAERRSRWQDRQCAWLSDADVREHTRSRSQDAATDTVIFVTDISSAMSATEQATTPLLAR